jgi:hypothetical protein
MHFADKPAVVWNEVLLAAVAARKPDIVRYILSPAANIRGFRTVNAHEQLSTAAAVGDVEILSHFWTMFVVQQVALATGQVRAYALSAMDYAAFNHHIPALRFLNDKSADAFVIKDAAMLSSIGPVWAARLSAWTKRAIKDGDTDLLAWLTHQAHLKWEAVWPLAIDAGHVSVLDLLLHTTTRFPVDLPKLAATARPGSTAKSWFDLRSSSCSSSSSSSSSASSSSTATAAPPGGLSLALAAPGAAKPVVLAQPRVTAVPPCAPWATTDVIVDLNTVLPWSISSKLAESVRHLASTPAPAPASSPAPAPSPAPLSSIVATTRAPVSTAPALRLTGFPLPSPPPPVA